MSLISPAWATRYFAVVVGPLLLIAAAGLVRAGRLGLVALIAIGVLWSNYVLQDNKENAREIAAGLVPYVHPGGLVHLDRSPSRCRCLRYYLGPGLRFATTLGPVPDPQIMDWRDALSRLRKVTPAADLDAVAGRR